MAAFSPVGVEATVKNLTRFVKSMGIMQGAIGGVAASITTFALNSAVQMTKALIGIGKASVEEAIKFEDSFAGIRKTVETTEEEFQQLSDSMRELATIVPVDVNELNKIAELGGQLGVVDENTEDVSKTLTEFTEVIAALGVSTNLTTEAAATQLARFSNIMGTTAEYGDETFSRLGSTIVDLGNNFATTESDILNFGLRVAGAGEIAGLTEADVLAIGAAMSSVGVQANAGGTAVQKTLIKINEAVTTGGAELEVFAATAGMSAADFAAMWEADAGGAFNEFVKGLGASGDDAILILDELGLKDQRLVRAFLSLANAGDLLERTMDSANTSFEANSALMEEAQKRYATTASQWEIFKNTIKDVAIGIGSFALPILNDLMKTGGAIIKTVRHAIKWGENLDDFLVGVPENMKPLVTLLGDVGFYLGEFGRYIGFVISAGDPLNDYLANFPTSLQPFILGIGEVVAWLKENIPIAISTAVSFFTQVFLPALQQAWTWIGENLIPVFKTVASWFQQLLPIAIDVISTYITSILIPKFLAMQEQFDQKIKPALMELWAWLQERVPQAIAVLAQFWESTLKPAMQALGVFISETLIPILADIMAWLITHIPVAIDAAVDFWVNVLQPALQQVWKFIQEKVIPIFVEIVAWLQENVPIAIAELTRFWEETLLPALQEVWAFIEEYLLPLFEALGEFISASLTWFIESLAITWNETLLPALKEVWEFIKTNLFPLLEKLGKWLSDVFQKGLEAVKNLLGKVTGKLKEWAEAIKKVDPSNLWPFAKQSPVPLAEGLKEIGAAMGRLSSVEFPMFNSQLAASAAMASAPVSAGPVVPNRNVTINMGGNNIASDIDMRVFEANVLRVVTENI